jgi:foldase protein PrsA
MLFNKKKAWKLGVCAVAAVLAASMLAGCEKKGSGETTNPGKVVATYKGGEITEKELETQKKIISFMSPEYAQLINMSEFQNYMVKQKIAFAYLSSKASESAKKEGEKQAVQVLEQNRKNLGDKQYENLLKAQSLNEEDLKQYLVQAMTAMEDMTSKVTEDEIKNKYEATKQDYMVATLHNVLIALRYGDKKERTKDEALKIAKDVKSQLDQGADIAEMAKKYSDDSSSKENGGLYDHFTVGQFNSKEFKEQILKLPLNKISDPFESALGYHIVKVDSREETPYDKLSSEQKNVIKQTLGAAKIDDFMQNQLKDIIQKIDLPKAAETPAGGADANKSEKDAPKSGDGAKGYSETVNPQGPSGK